MPIRCSPACCWIIVKVPKRRVNCTRRSERVQAQAPAPSHARVDTMHCSYISRYYICRTKPRVPREEDSNSKIRRLSASWASFKRATELCSSPFRMSSSECIRRNRFRSVWTASKSRCDMSRRVRVLINWSRSSKETSDLSSSSSAAGESVLVRTKKDSSARMMMS